MSGFFVLLLQERGYRETQIMYLAIELLSYENVGEDNYIPINNLDEPQPNSYRYHDTQFRLLGEDLLESYREVLHKLGSNY